MIFALFIFSLLNPSLSLVEVAPGTRAQIPEQFMPLEQIRETRIGQSYWVKIHIDGGNSAAVTILGGKPYMRRISWYDGEQKFLATGNSLNIRPAAGEQMVYYAYFPFADGKDKELFSISLLPTIDYVRDRTEMRIQQYVFHSILCFLIICALVFALISRGKVYLYYALYLLALVWFFSYQYGILGEWIPLIDSLPPLAFWLSGFTISFFYALFSIHFLDLKANDLFAYRIVLIGLVFMLSIFVFSGAFYLTGIDIQHNIYYKSGIMIFQLILVTIYIIQILRLEGPLKNYFLASAAILLAISITGQVHSTFKLVDDFNNIAQAGLILEVFVLTIGLGVRVYEIQKSRNKAQNQLIDQLQLNQKMQLEYAEKLKQEVEDRTYSLVHKNRENELLLKEIHHRVKNNLQVITSILNLQERRANPSMAEIFSSTRNKILSIALIHEHLYSNQNMGQVMLDQYIELLIQMIADSLQSARIDLQLDIPSRPVKITSAIHIGLIINELLTNSIKYAFQEHPDPQLSVVITAEQDKLTMDYSDNGPGDAATIEKTGLGFTIIQAILASTNGFYEFHNRSPGWLTVYLEFELTDSST